jgi:EAL domain-containing protein (putative c-di-GMP-specific phosphodiesterase class I)
MANGLGMTTTAEGVETKEQLDTVRAEGCTEMQGYVYSKPMSAGEVEKFLRDRRNAGTRQEDPAQRPGDAADAA